YVHITPSPDETIALQQRGWKLDAVMPAAYRNDNVTQQWSVDLDHRDFMRLMRVKQTFFDLIKRGEKTLEVRVAYDNIKTIRPGERIRLSSRTQTQVIHVKDVRHYPNFREMLDREDATKIAPGKNRQELLELLTEIYPEDRESLGVVVLDIESV